MPPQHDDCPLCCPNPKDILFDSNNFYLMTSKSAGDTIIIPKDHYVTMADLPEEFTPEFDEMRHLVKKILRVDFGSCVFYEHTGGGYAWTFVGHGDGHGHAHLHCATAVNGLLTRLPESYVKKEVDSWRQVLDSRRGGENYFYFEDKNDKKFVILVTDEGRHLAEDVMK